MEENDGIFDTSKIQFTGDFDQQVLEVLQFIRLTREEVENLQKLFDDLYDTLNGIWPNIKVAGFGSIVTGLGIKTSDVDCYVELPHWLNPPERSHVLKAKNAMMRCQHLYQDAFAIVNARVPIIQFYHVPTERNCDVNFNSPIGVHNSKLIGYLLRSDKRTIHLAILIKYWAKIHNLTGTNFMSNYCLTMLVIFFLQQQNILPAVVDLQKDVNENYVDHWNTAFKEIKNENSNSSSLYKLLGDFFQFYKRFEYDKYIISPFLGRPVERDLFKEITNVPSDFGLYKSNVNLNNCKAIRLESVICVQDPFEHNRNCSIAVHPKLAKKILSYICLAVSIYEGNDERDFLKKLLTRAAEANSVPKEKPIPVRYNGVHKNYKRNRNFKNFRQNAKNFKQIYFNSRNQKNM